MTDLFGQEIFEPVILVDRHGNKKRSEIPKGYAAQPGTGPKGETCKTCKWYVSLRYHDKTYPKCGLKATRKVISKPGQPTRIGVNWSHCYASDIRAKSPACRLWQMPDPVEWVRE